MANPGWEEILITSQVDGSALSATGAASALPAAAKYTLPTNYFNVIGKQLIIEATGRISFAVTTPGTPRFDVRFGATVVFDGLATTRQTTNAYSNVGFHLRIVLTCRAIGASANLMGQGTLAIPGITTNAAMPIAADVAMLPWNSAPAVGSNFDSTVTQQVDLFFTQTVNTGSMTLHQFTLKGRNLPQ